MSDQSNVFVKKAGSDQAALVGEILGEAFSGDPVMTWISPDLASGGALLVTAR